MTSTNRRGMVPEDLYRLHTAGDAQISPDGRRVAFVQTRLDKEADDYRSTIWVMPADGGEPAQFTNGGRRDTAPAWSPDGRWLAFLSNRSTDKVAGSEAKSSKEKPKNQIWLMPSDGGEARRLTDLKGGAGSITWSPDGRRIACVSRVSSEPDEPKEKQAKAADGEEQTPKTRIITTLKYKLNGEGFTYDRRPHIFLVTVDGGEPSQITDGEFNDEDPAWSPDGHLIAFTSARHAERDFNNVTDIYVVAAEGGSPRQITPGRGPSHDPAFSPDGRSIAYYGHSDPHAGGARNTTLWTIPVEGGEPANLSAALDRPIAGDMYGNSARPPAWSPDGATIYFAVADWGTAGIRTVSANGGEVRSIAAGRRVIGAWSLDAAAARLAFISSEPEEPADLYVLDLGSSNGSGERRLTRLNAAWLQEVTLARPEEFTYTSVDGWTVEGWIMRPAGYEAGRTYPLLLNVHGGPHANYGWGFFDEFQVQAGAGYAVLYTNPRGSQSYGEGFADACSKDWGGKDYQDVINGLDHALDRFDFIDPERLGVLGGSYGGFMTSWIVGHTDRFKAAVSERAVNALYSMFGSSDIGYHFQEFEIGGTPQESLDFYIERSPVTYAAQMTTPLLIIHSENDLRCPMEQAEQLYVTLKVLRRTDVVFVRFPEENHELSRGGKPSRRVERFQLILDWFATQLRGEQTRFSRQDPESVGSR